MKMTATTRSPLMTLLLMLGLASVALMDSSRLFNLKLGKNSPESIIHPSGEIEGFPKVTITPSTNWIQLDKGLYLTTDQYSISAIVCNDDGTKCKGIPYKDRWVNTTYPDPNFSSPKILSVGKYADGYYFVYQENMTTGAYYSSANLSFFKKPDFDKDSYLKIYKSHNISATEEQNQLQ